MKRKKIEKFIGAAKNKNDMPFEDERDKAIKASKVRNSILAGLWGLVFVSAVLTGNVLGCVLSASLILARLEAYWQEQYTAHVQWGYKETSRITDDLVQMVKEAQDKAAKESK